jgi:hypothetical protein
MRRVRELDSGEAGVGGGGREAKCKRSLAASHALGSTALRHALLWDACVTRKVARCATRKRLAGLVSRTWA